MNDSEVITNGILLAIYTTILLTGLVQKLPLSEEINKKLPEKIDGHLDGMSAVQLEESEDWVSRYYGVLWAISVLVMVYANYGKLSRGKYKLLPFMLLNTIAAALGLLTGHYSVLIDLFKKVLFTPVLKQFVPLDLLSGAQGVFMINAIFVAPALLGLGLGTGYIKYNNASRMALITGLVGILIGFAIRYLYFGRINDETVGKCAADLKDAQNATEKAMDEYKEQTNKQLENKQNLLDTRSKELSDCRAAVSTTNPPVVNEPQSTEEPSTSYSLFV